MRAAAGQAVRFAGLRLHGLGQILLALLVVMLSGAAALVWRLDQGPLDVPWVAKRIEKLAAAHGVRVQIGRAQVAWGGFSGGVGEPLEVILSDLDAAAWKLHAGTVAAGFSILSLLGGDVVPGGLQVDGLRAEVQRRADGSFAWGLSPANPPAQVPHTKGGEGSADWTKIRHLHVHDAQVAGFDATVGLSWQLGGIALDLDRSDRGVLSGQAAASLQAGGQIAGLTLTARPDGAASRITAHLTTLNPSTLAALSPFFAAASILDAPVTLSATARLDADLAPSAAHLEAQLGAGTVHAGTGTAPILGGTLQADATRAAVDAVLRLDIAAAPQAPATHIAGRAHARRGGPGWQASVMLTVDQVSFSDLPALWPEGTGGKGARVWITQNITSGQAQDGHATLTLEAPADLSDVRLAAIDAAIDGHDLTVWWLRPVPPMVHGEAHLTVTNPDVIDIAVLSARQSTGTRDGVAHSNGLVHITGISQPDQVADISSDLSGRVPDLIAVLQNKRIGLLDKRPVPMKDPSGQFTGHLTVDHLLLRDDLKMDDLKIAVKAHFADLHLGGIAGGHDLDHGAIDLQADNDGLHAGGTALLAGIDSSLQVAMDFRAGKPADIVQDVTVSGVADEHTLAGAGLDPHGALKGPVALQARLRTERRGHSDVTASADATKAAVTVPQIGYDKSAGKPLHADLALVLDNDRLTAIDHVRIEGDGISVIGAAEVAEGRPDLVRFESLALGAATRAHGTMRLPQRPSDPYVLVVSGPSLDASGPLNPGNRAPPRSGAGSGAGSGGGSSGSGVPFIVDARFDRVLLGHGREVLDASAHAESDGKLIRTAQLTGLAQSVRSPRDTKPQPFRVTLAPEAGGRRLVAQAPDAGGLLRALGIADDISGGRMNIGAHYDDAAADHPLTGTAELNDFRVLDAPAIGRILQAATLYGLVEVLRGPGLGFLRAVAPFRWVDGRLTLSNARAYSASLGLTAQGDVDLDDHRLDLTGTVVPLYALNTLPGRIPLIGRLFSPEKSGGLFAATYSVSGPMRDPKVAVNALAAAAPGILRKLFTLF